MMIVNEEKCIGCGLCVKDCFPKDIDLIDKKAKINNVTCFKCGHCIAVCPKDAVTTDEYNMSEVVEYDKDKFQIDSDNLMNFIKFRRSIRQFKDKEVEEEKLSKIIEAGRFTETAGNMQDVSYIVIREGLQELRKLTLETLNTIGKEILSNITPENIMYVKYAKLWVKMYKKYKENPDGEDELFFNAPAVIVVAANFQVNGVLASSNMELMTNALDLGALFSGFFVRAAAGNKEIREFLGIKEGKEIATCMIIGYPNIKYKRTVPRKTAEIFWK
ncbi:nitroreductase family protein [uncultured Ilyobacter sp.]|uniref:nitroreductase family protein n=1 Tax=uncultured Ilyobacter sp. TaxID=544433 RepID=UPI0029F5ABFD|nr:nitroreductase family protein [uncultured Ilyobacter sp.]